MMKIKIKITRLATILMQNLYYPLLMTMYKQKMQIFNVETDIDERLVKEYEKGLQEINNLDDISNLCETSEEENEIDDFKNSEQRIDKFKKTLFPKSKENDEPNSFISVILHAIRFQKEQKTNICSKGNSKEIIDENLINELD